MLFVNWGHWLWQLHKVLQNAVFHSFANVILVLTLIVTHNSGGWIITTSLSGFLEEALRVRDEELMKPLGWWVKHLQETQTVQPPALPWPGWLRTFTDIITHGTNVTLTFDCSSNVAKSVVDLDPNVPGSFVWIKSLLKQIWIRFLHKECWTKSRPGPQVTPKTVHDAFWTKIFIFLVFFLRA